MARLQIAPFIQLPEEETTGILHAFDWVETTKAKAWDYKVDLNYQRVLEIKKDALREYCQLAENAKLSIFAEWSTSLSSYVRERSPEVILDLEGEDAAEVAISLPVRGTDTGGELTLRTMIIVYEPGDTKAPGALKCGSILWSDEIKFLLEAPGARLPICVENFERFPEKFDNSRASWFVEVLPDGLEYSASVGMVIYINSQKRNLVTLITAEEKSIAAALLVKMLTFDVQRQLLSIALHDEQFIDPHWAYEEGTLGASLRLMCRNIFGQASLPEVANLFRLEPARFETELQGSTLQLEELLLSNGMEVEE